jgi:D-aminopeptidase
VVPEHVFAACEGAIGGQPIEEGSVGGGTACAAFEYKSGCGTASRRAGQWMVGVFVQSICGSRGNLKITGVPIQDSGLPSLYDEDAGKDLGSIAIIIATDAPLLPNQLRILAKHATHGIARTGALSGTLSGDFAIAFSTANPGLHERLRTASETDDPVVGEPGVYNEMLHVLSDQVVFATEEAIINALIASDTMEGFGHVAYKLPLKVIAKSFSEHRLPRINI